VLKWDLLGVVFLWPKLAIDNEDTGEESCYFGWKSLVENEHMEDQSEG